MEWSGSPEAGMEVSKVGWGWTDSQPVRPKRLSKEERKGGEADRRLNRINFQTLGRVCFLVH